MKGELKEELNAALGQLAAAYNLVPYTLTLAGLGPEFALPSNPRRMGFYVNCATPGALTFYPGDLFPLGLIGPIAIPLRVEPFLQKDYPGLIALDWKIDGPGGTVVYLVDVFV